MFSIDQTVLFWVVAWMPRIASQVVSLRANCSTHGVQPQKNSCPRKCCGCVVGSMVPVVVPEWMYCIYRVVTYQILRVHCILGDGCFNALNNALATAVAVHTTNKRPDSDGWMYPCVYIHHTSRKKHRLTNGWLLRAVISFYCVNLRSEAGEYSH